MENSNLQLQPVVVEQLNDILTYLHDSEKGYQECAKVINENRLKPFLMEESQERHSMIYAIENQIANKSHQKPVHRGSLAGPLHRIFVDVKALLTHGNVDTILNEIKRGDTTLVNSYKEVLREPLPPELYDALNSQLDHVKDTLSELDSLSIRH